MALGAEMARPFPAMGGGDDEVSARPAETVSLVAAETTDRPVDPVVIWGDEKRMKQELVAWAKTVASMVAAGKNNN
jgi:hypothetical protein